MRNRDPLLTLLRAERRAVMGQARPVPDRNRHPTLYALADALRPLPARRRKFRFRGRQFGIVHSWVARYATDLDGTILVGVMDL